MNDLGTLSVNVTCLAALLAVVRECAELPEDMFSDAILARWIMEQATVLLGQPFPETDMTFPSARNHVKKQLRKMHDDGSLDPYVEHFTTLLPVLREAISFPLGMISDELLERWAMEALAFWYERAIVA